MSVESSMRESDRWFLGELKVLRYTVRGVPADDPLVGWTMRWELTPRRGRAAVAVKATGSGVYVVGPNVVDVQIAAQDTAALTEGAYQTLLRRVDPGKEQVLALYRAVLRDPRDVR